MEHKILFKTMTVLETKPINELLSLVDIKVCYVSNDTVNRNSTVITEEVGKQIAESLPGAPIVGLFNTKTDDYEEHSREIIVGEEGIEIKELTRPYGFVSFDAPWFQDFVEDGVVRKYLMCKGFLWTRQYQEAKKAIGKGQSMELDTEVEGYYDGDVFIFTSATLSKLCILGDDYEPCFEGARIIASHKNGFETIAKEYSKVTGLNYSLAGDKLKRNYAAKVSGWDSEDEVGAILREQNPNIGFNVIGIFHQEGNLFAVFQINPGVKYFKVDISYDSEDNLILSKEWVEVKKMWVPAKKELLGGQMKDKQNFGVNTKPEGGVIEVPKVEAAEEVIEEPVVQESQESQVLQKTDEELRLEAALAELSKYKAIVAKIENEKKEEIINKFSSKLSAEVIAEVEARKDSMSSEDLEKELAVQFSRIALAADMEVEKKPEPSIQFQLEADNSSEVTQPEWFKRALEYDEANSFSL